MRLLIKIVVVLLLLAIALAIGTLWRNRVPLSEPPGLTARLLTYFSKNVAQTEADSRFPELRPKSYPVTSEQLFGVTRETVVALGWHIESMGPGAHRLHAVVTTPWLRFKDDVVVEIRAVDDQQSALFIKSESRVGRADYGANLRHILDLMHNVEQKLQLELGPSE